MHWGPEGASWKVGLRCKSDGSRSAHREVELTRCSHRRRCFVTSSRWEHLCWSSRPHPLGLARSGDLVSRLESVGLKIISKKRQSILRNKTVSRYVPLHQQLTFKHVPCPVAGSAQEAFDESFDQEFFHVFSVGIEITDANLKGFAPRASKIFGWSKVGVKKP